VLLCFVLAVLPQPIDFDGIGPERARSLSGRLVVASFVAGEPHAYPEWGVTTTGADTREDGAERVAVLRGTRYDVRAGELVRVVGVLEVIDHPAAFVGAVLVPPWVEIRVSGGGP
jgi:hypothetical protein